MNSLRSAIAKRARIMVVLVVLTSCSGPLARGQGRNETIANTGQAAPDGNGSLSSFGNPVLNESGAAAFSSTLTGTSGGIADNSGIFRGTGGSLTQIAREGQLAPDGNGTLSIFGNTVLNDLGAAAFTATLTGTSGGAADNSGIFRGTGGSLTQIARAGQLAPDGNGTLQVIFIPVLNDSGATAFLATLTGTSGGGADNSGIFRGTGGSLTQIARAGQLAPDGNGTLASFSFPVLNDSGAAAFSSTLTGTSGGGADNGGIFRNTGGSLTQIAREGQLAPDGNGMLSSLAGPVLNDSDAAAFLALLTGTSGGSADNSGIFRGTGGSLTQIARAGQLAPDGNGSLFSFVSPVLNDSGAVAFKAGLTGTSGGTADDLGIFRGTGGSITQIAREGQLAPGGNGTLSGFFDPRLNDSGAAAFLASLTGTSGGGADNSGIYAADGIDFLQVIREGDSLSGSIVTGFGLSDDFINNRGQVAYRALLANGTSTVQRWTPDLHWRATFSSSWDTDSRWTLGLNPDLVHDVFIDPTASVTVTGPAANTTVRSLQIGGGSGMAKLNLQSGSTLTASNGVTILSTGTLTGDGTIGGNVVNNGTVQANNVSVTGTLTNNNTILGDGRVHAAIVNAAGGKVRALGGDRLWLSGPSFNNSGLVEVNSSELQIDASVVNQASTGLISLRNGSLIADAGITNSGSIAMTLGASTIQGDVNNTGIIQVSGGAHATFFGDVNQNGVMQVSTVGSTVSTAVILGSFSGSGGFTGGGDVFALGDLRPGNSPDSVLYDGNLFLGATTDAFFELGGLSIGDFDQMLVSGDLNLAGDLFVSLIDGHTLGFNQQYLIGDIGDQLFGQFSGFGEGASVGNFGGMDLFITYTGGNGNDIGLFTAVPEPGSAGVVALLALFATFKIRNRKRYLTPFV